MEKLFVGGEVLDGGVEVVVELFAKDAGSFAEGFGAGGEERDFWGRVCGFGFGLGLGFGGAISGAICGVLDGLEEVMKVGVRKVREVEGGILLKVFDEEIEESNGAVEWSGRGFNGPSLDGLGSFWAEGDFCSRSYRGRVVGWVGPEGVIDDFEIEEDCGEKGEGKCEEVMGVGGEPVLGRGGDGFRKVFEIFVIKMDVLCMIRDEGAGLADAGEGGEVGSVGNDWWVRGSGGWHD